MDFCSIENCETHSNELVGRDFWNPASAGVSVSEVKGFRVVGVDSGVPGVPRRAMAFSFASSFRITATSAACWACAR